MVFRVEGAWPDILKIQNICNRKIEKLQAECSYCNLIIAGYGTSTLAQASFTGNERQRRFLTLTPPCGFRDLGLSLISRHASQA